MWSALGAFVQTALEVAAGELPPEALADGLEAMRAAVPTLAAKDGATPGPDAAIVCVQCACGTYFPQVSGVVKCSDCMKPAVTEPAPSADCQS